MNPDFTSNKPTHYLLDYGDFLQRLNMHVISSQNEYIYHVLRFTRAVQKVLGILV